jgi:hypothetical protein
MWMRRGKGACWKERNPNDSAQVSRAIDDLMRSEDEKPSFYRVDSYHEALEFAELYAVTQITNPQSTDFLLLPENLLPGFLFSFQPDPNLHPVLQQRHFELEGMNNRSHLESFICRAFSIVSIARFKREALSQAFRSRLRHDPEVLTRCDDRWKRA